MTSSYDGKGYQPKRRYIINASLPMPLVVASIRGVKKASSTSQTQSPYPLSFYVTHAGNRQMVYWSDGKLIH